MSTAVIVTVVVIMYLVGWMFMSITVARMLAVRQAKCCRTDHRGDDFCVNVIHWRGDGTVGFGEMWFGSLAGLGWPLLILPAVAWSLANRRPTTKALEQTIARLEREAGMS